MKFADLLIYTVTCQKDSFAVASFCSCFCAEFSLQISGNDSLTYTVFGSLGRHFGYCKLKSRGVWQSGIESGKYQTSKFCTKTDPSRIIRLFWASIKN